MKTTKKVLAIVLSVMLLLSVMPMAVFAATTTTVSTVTEFETAVANASAGDTIKLGANIDFTTDSKYAANSYSVEESYVDITGLTIDLDGNTITNNTAGLKFSGSNCVIKNGKIIGVADTYTRRYGLALWSYDAYVQGEADSIPAGAVYGQNVVLEDLEVDGGINILGHRDVIIRDCTVYGNSYYAVYLNFASDVTIESGSYTAANTKVDGIVACYNAASLDPQYSTKINIEGGTFTLAKSKLVLASSGPVEISGGTYKNADSSAYTVPAKYIAEGAVQDSETGTVTQAYVAKVNDTCYETLEAALDAATSGDTVTLLADIDFRDTYSWGVAHYIDISGLTLDLNGHTINVRNFGVIWTGQDITIKNGTFVGEKRSSTSYGLHLYGKDNTGTDLGDTPGSADIPVKNAVLEDLTVVGGVNIWYAENVVLKNCNVQGQNYYAVWANTGSDVTIESGTYTSDCAKTSALLGASKENLPKGNMKILGGDFTVPANKDLVLTSHAKENVKISGGTFNVVVPTINCAEGFVPVTEPNEQGKYTVAVDNAVAEVNGVKYDTLEEAIASISNVTSAAHSKSVDGDTTTPYYTYVANGEVKLLKDANGNGLMFGAGTNLTIDFNGHTYEIDGRTVGSNGSERCGFNFAKNSDITLKNGTLTSEKAKILVQNYADLTVENMTLTNANEGAGKFYTLSNNFGDVVITDSVINAADNGTSYAYDISTGWAAAYADGVTVTMNGTTTINGNIEVGSYANYPGTATVALYLTSGTINGEIVASAYDTSWEKVSDDLGDNIVVTKSDECSYAAPEDYKWVSNGDGTSSLEKIETKNGANLTLEGTIEEAIYLDANSYDIENDAVVKVTANASSNISEEPNVVTTTYNVKDLTPFVDPKGTYTGTYKFAIKNAPAQITEEIKVELFASASDTKPIKTITYSVKEYCDTVIKTSNNDKLVALCKAILDYGRAAQLQFDYNLANMASDSFYNADAIEALTYSDITDTYLDASLDIRGCTFQCLANTNINLYLYNSLTSSEMDASIDGDDESAIKADYMTSEQNGLFISVNNIEAGNLNKNFTVITSDGYVTTNARTIIKTCLYYGTAETLVKTIYFYANAADAYFN